MLTNSTKCWYTFICRLLMLGNERRMQPMSKVTRHRSEVKPSRRIRRVHEDLRAHQSTQTTSRQAMTHIHNMRAHLAASRPRFGPNGHLVWPADHVVAAHGPHRLSNDTWRGVVGPQWRFGSMPGRMAGGSVLQIQGEGCK